MSAKKTTVPALMAHRGYTARYPENSLEGIEAALQAGARLIEFDTHMSADEVPVLFHDAELSRTTGAEGRVFETPLAELQQLEANESSRLGEAFSGVRIPTLQAFVRLMADWPDATAFVELKRTSLQHFGTDRFVRRTLEVLRPIQQRSVIISFNREALIEARAQGAGAVGWILEGWDEKIRRTAEELAPDYIFCNHTRIHPDTAELWPGPWCWVLYEVVTVEHALALAARGADIVESMVVAELLNELSGISGDEDERAPV